MKILLTGSNGFIGGELVSALRKKYPETLIIGLDINMSDKFSHSIKADITSKDLIEHPVWKEVDYIYHLAALANLDIARRLKQLCFRVNTYGTFNIARIARRYKIPMCYISTADIYGNSKDVPYTEETLPSPTEIYATTKLTGEYFVKTLVPKWCILRYATVISPNMRKELVTYIFLNKAINNESITIHGKGTQKRTWIFIDDLVEATIKVMDLGIFNEIINIAGKESISVSELGKLSYEVVHGEGCDYKIDFLPEREGQIFNKLISIEKAKKLLNWYPKIDIKEALDKCYRSWKE